MTPFVDFDRLVKVTGGEVLIATDRAGSGASIDTRSLVPGEIFFALKGEKVHGHSFVTKAASLGASAVVLDGSTGGLPELEPLERMGRVGAIVVADPRLALWKLAEARRAEFEGTVVAVCGSNGKTTTKNLAGAICRAFAPSLFTHGSFNNDLGVPLTILRFEPYHRFAVLELGMNHPGEIDRLAGLARPQGAVITNIGPEHLEGLGSIEGVARAEAEVIRHLPPDGFLAVNTDDEWCLKIAEGFGGMKIRYGSGQDADVAALDHRTEDDGAQRFTLVYGMEKIPVRLPLVGRHNVMNAMAAAALAMGLRIPADAVREALEAAEPGSLRGRLVRTPGGTQVFVDCYNANPASMEVAMASLDTLSGNGPKIAVLGQMGELGADSDSLHREVGRAAGRFGMSAIYAWGAGGKLIASGAREAGVKLAEAFESHVSLLEALVAGLKGGERIVIKGSRTSAMEKVADPLLERLGGPGMGGAH